MDQRKVDERPGDAAADLVALAVAEAPAMAGALAHSGRMDLTESLTESVLRLDRLAKQLYMLEMLWHKLATQQRRLARW